MDSKIEKFIKKNHVAALSIQHDDGTWCCNCFYAFHDEDPHIVFLSHGDTLHAKLMTKNPKISGAIAGQTKTIASIQGIQFTGLASFSQDQAMRKVYNKRFPFAALVEASMWVIRLDTIKYTSNIIKFGNKLYWSRY